MTTRVGRFLWGLPDETADSAVAFLRSAFAYYARLGVTIRCVLTDDGAAYRSKIFAALCDELGIKHPFTRPYTPRTNGKAERFIQAALPEWAYARIYQNSAEPFTEQPIELQHLGTGASPPSTPRFDDHLLVVDESGRAFLRYFSTWRRQGFGAPGR